MTELLMVETTVVDSPPTDDLIVAEGLSKQYNVGGEIVNAVDEIDLRIARGKLVALRGQSGSGKSTLLSLIGALDTATSGTLLVDSVNVTALKGKAEVEYRRSKTGFVFQSFNLIPHLTALENVMLPMEFVGVSTQQQLERARDLLKRVVIQLDRQLHRPSRLSGGQQQRVAIARALANDPSVILADEPTANLDSKTGTQIIDLLRKLVDENRTVIVATHDDAIAAKANVVVEMLDGKIVGNQVKRVKTSAR
ncbi:ABC transporter ATP-binding protein [soil metagenome]